MTLREVLEDAVVTDEIFKKMEDGMKRYFHPMIIYYIPKDFGMRIGEARAYQKTLKILYKTLSQEQLDSQCPADLFALLVPMRFAKEALLHCIELMEKKTEETLAG